LVSSAALLAERMKSPHGPEVRVLALHQVALENLCAVSTRTEGDTPETAALSPALSPRRGGKRDTSPRRGGKKSASTAPGKEPTPESKPKGK